MYSPSEKQQNDMARLGDRKQIIIKGRRTLKPYVKSVELVNSK